MEQIDKRTEQFELSKDELEIILSKLTSPNPDMVGIKEIIAPKMDMVNNDEELLQLIEPKVKSIVANSFNKVDPDRQSLVAKELLEKKYGKKFEVLRFGKSRFPENYYSLDCYEKEHPSLIFEALVDEKDGEIQDSYMTKILCEHIRERIINNLSFFKGDLDVLVFSEILFTELNEQQIDINNISLILPHNKYSIHLFFDEHKEHNQLEYRELPSIFQDLNNLKGSINIFYVSTEKKKEAFEYVNKRAKLYSSYWELMGETHLGCIQFDSGRILISEEEYNLHFIKA